MGGGEAGVGEVWGWVSEADMKARLLWGGSL